MNRIKAFAQDFPSQGGGAVVALTLIFLTGLAVVVRLLIGQPFPDGYDTWIWALVALSGVSTAGMIGKRATDRELQRIKASGPSQVSVAGPVDVTVESEEKG
jgi:hypothetical protein